MQHSRAASRAASRDGRWALYASNESGRDEIFLAPYPGPGGKWQVSTSGGDSAAWGPGDREIFYETPDTGVMAVEVKLGSGSAETAVPHLLFRDPSLAMWTVDRTTGRFLVGKAPEDAQTIPITLVSNWTAKLTR